MAISGGDGSIILTTNVDQSGLKKGLGSMKKLGSTAGNAFLAIGAAAATATVAITKMATDAYAEYEQLVGGVETLFKGSTDKVMAYAENAFATAGVSANEYMSIVTSFSASLLQSLGGDTDKAADVANQALIDMSDNANKMGTSMEAIQNAYQGFAKQNYTMLDNLKLGYGGTKTEMERLLRDAEALTGVKYDISNLADVYNAIHAIQENLGITGTTALEAEKTISGSANMMKAAWQNVLTAIAGGGDLDRAINNLVYSIQKYFENIVPVVERSLQGIGQLIERVAPMLVQTVARSLIKAIPSLLNAVYQMVIGLAKGIYQGIVDLFSGGAEQVLEKQTNEIAQSVENQNALTDAVEETAKAQEKSLAGFDELNILSAKATENQSVEPVLPNTGESALRDNIDVEGVKSEVSEIGGVFDIIKEKIVKIGKSLYSSFKPSIKAIEKEIPKISRASQKAFEVIGKSTTELYNDSIKPLGDRVVNEFIPQIVNSTTENLAPIAADIASVGIETFAETYEWGTEQISKINSDIVEPAMETLTTITTDTMDSLGNAWDEYGNGITQEMSEVDNNARNLWDSLYEKVAQPIFGPLMDEINKLWEEHLKPLWDEITLFFGSITEYVLTFWNEVLSPAIDLIVSVLSPIVVNAVNAIKDVVSTVIGIISDVLSGLLRSIRGIIDFITGVFQGDWEQAWNGIKDFFGGIWDMIWGIIKGVINLIIDGLNTLWRAIYSVFAGVVNGIGGAVSWVGELFGKDWGFSMPSEPPLIPKLAQGAVLPPNKPFLAMVGDQKHGTNIEAPLDTIVEAFKMAQSQTPQGAQNVNIKFTGSLAELARVLKPAIELETRRDSVFA